jgi:hypothetical protein
MAQPSDLNGFKETAQITNAELDTYIAESGTQEKQLNTLGKYLKGFLHTTGWTATDQFKQQAAGYSVNLDELGTKIIDHDLWAEEYNKYYFQAYDKNPKIRHMRSLVSGYRLIFKLEPGTNKAVFLEYLTEPDAIDRYGTKSIKEYQ